MLGSPYIYKNSIPILEGAMEKGGMEVIPFKPNDTSEDGGHLLKQITKMIR